MYVQSPPEVGAIPLAHFIHTDPRDAADSLRYIQRAKNGGGNPFNDDPAAQLRRMLESGFDLESAWFQATTSRPLDQGTCEKLRNLFLRYATERQKLWKAPRAARARRKTPSALPLSANPFRKRSQKSSLTATQRPFSPPLILRASPNAGWRAFSIAF